MADGKGQSKTTQKPAHCECPGLTGNAWKCNRGFWEFIKKSHLSGDYLLFDISIESLRKAWVAFLLFILLWILLPISYINEIFSKYMQKYIQKTPKMLFINEVYFKIPKVPEFFQRFSNTLNFIEGHFRLILFIVLIFAFILAYIFKKLHFAFYFFVYFYIITASIVLILKYNTHILLANNQFPSITMGFITALFAMAIPMGIAIYSDLSRNRAVEAGEEEFNYFKSLDLQVFLKYKINPWHFIFWLLVTFVPLLIFQTKGINIDTIKEINIDALIRQSTAVSASFIGMLFLAYRLIKIYNWTEKEKIEYRKRYLNNAGFNKEFIDAWKSVWITKDIDEKEEKEYLCIFVRRVIESLSCKEKLDITKKLLEDFKENLSNRNFENMRFIHDILIEIAEEIKISKFKDKTVYTIPSIKNTPNIINEILNHINNYEWKNSNKTCYNAVCYIYLYNLFNYPVYYSFHRK